MKCSNKWKSTGSNITVGKRKKSKNHNLENSVVVIYKNKPSNASSSSEHRVTALVATYRVTALVTTSVADVLPKSIIAAHISVLKYNNKCRTSYCGERYIRPKRLYMDSYANPSSDGEESFF